MQSWAERRGFTNIRPFPWNMRQFAKLFQSFHFFEKNKQVKQPSMDYSPFPPQDTLYTYTQTVKHKQVLAAVDKRAWRKVRPLVSGHKRAWRLVRAGLLHQEPVMPSNNEPVRSGEVLCVKLIHSSLWHWMLASLHIYFCFPLGFLSLNSTFINFITNFKSSTFSTCQTPSKLI